MVKELSSDYKEVLQKETKPYLLELYTTWCGICKQVVPLVEEIEPQFKNEYAFYKANMDELLELGREYDAKSVPTLLFIKDGEVKQRHTGFITKAEIIEKLKESFK